MASCDFCGKALKRGSFGQYTLTIEMFSKPVPMQITTGYTNVCPRCLINLLQRVEMELRSVIHDNARKQESPNAEAEGERWAKSELSRHYDDALIVGR